MKINEKGFSAIEVLIVVIVIGVIGGAGWYVWQSKDKDPESRATTTQEKNKKEKSTDAKEKEKPDYSTFSVKPTGKLSDQGKCKSGEVLFAPLYSTSPGEPYEYDCQGPVDALQYASVVLGQRNSSVVGEFSSGTQQGEVVTLANGVEATKYSFTGQRKAHGAPDMLPTKYTIYEVTDGQEFFYALYWTGVGFQDENYYLSDFNEMALKNWEIK